MNTTQNFSFKDWTDPITGCTIDAHTAKPRVLARAIRRWVSDCGQLEIRLCPNSASILGGSFVCWSAPTSFLKRVDLIGRAHTLEAAIALCEREVAR